MKKTLMRNQGLFLFKAIQTLLIQTT